MSRAVREVGLVVAAWGLAGCYPFLWPDGGRPGPGTPTGTVVTGSDACYQCPDADGDGWGYWDTVRLPWVCGAPLDPGFGDCTVYGDCDDAEAGAHPGNHDDPTCDGVDDDCDRDYDEDAPGMPAAEQEYLPDADGDGYGDEAGDQIRACAAPAGHVVEEYLDCDDTDPAVHPFAIEWWDGLESDCDYDGSDLFLGLNDQPDKLLPSGSGVRLLLDLDADGDLDLVTERSSVHDFAYSGGRVDVYPGPLDDTPDGLGAPLVTVQGTVAMGNLTTVTGDVAGDGTVTLAFAAFGSLRVYSGPDPSGGPDLDVAALPAWSNLGSSASGRPAAVVVDGATGPEILAAGTIGPPASYVSRIRDLQTGMALGDVPDRIEGVPNEAVGAAVAIGDVDANGVTEVITSLSDPYTGVGAVALYLDVPVGVVPSSSAYARRDGFAVPPSHLLAWDVDGDGYEDVIAADPDHDYDRGVVTLFLGPLDGTSDLASANATWPGAAFSDRLGEVLVRGPDFDGDGADELVIGGTNGLYSLVDATQLGVYDDHFEPALVARWYGGGGGTAPAALGELNGDGLSDLVVGSSITWGAVRP